MLFESYTKAALLALGAFAQLEYPGDDCCTFFEAKNYEGDSWHVCKKSSTSTSETYNAGDYNFHDKMSSFWCGANVALDTCAGEDDCYRGDNTAGNVRSPQVGFNDLRGSCCC